MSRAADPVLTPVAALSAALVSGVLVAGAAVSDVATAGAFVVGALVLAVGWPRLLAVPSAGGVRVVVVLTAVLVAGVSALGEDERGMRWLPTVLAVALLAAFGHQLLRKDGRRRLVVTLASTCLAIGILGSGGFYLAALDERTGRQLVVAAVVACTIGMVVDVALARTSLAEWGLPVAMAASGIVAFVLAQSWGVRWSAMVLAAVAAPLVAQPVRRLLGHSSTARDRGAQVALGAASVLAAGITAYAVAWLFR
ncbi:hypothetical protein [Luteipulveratus flavus]|uniref:Uncharacterized protein n=1 Tax=Luteipulveratus flavus TaxID=3031728 RepID=A0ABT6C9H3_9MICO|nr:hypothetical protein [Luteipulveratus sp. YIM 133296]MDF8265561.1 hypothetical protein [Luteipulveratus sp. YIM 133296]